MDPVSAVWIATIALDAIRTWRKHNKEPEDQKRRNDEAESILSYIIEHGFCKDNLVLYLRPRVLTGKLPTGYRGTRFYEGWDFEYAFQQFVRSFGKFIALGDKDCQQIGAAKISTSDENWRAIVLLLAQQAKKVILVPSPSSYVIEEIVMVRDQGLLDKTIFCFLPNSDPNWKDNCKTLQDQGFTVPDSVFYKILFFKNSLVAIMFDSNLSVEKIWCSGRFYTAHFLKGIVQKICAW